VTFFPNVNYDDGLISLDRYENFAFDEYDLSLFFFCKLVPIRYTPLIKQNDVVVVVVVVREAKDDKKKSYEISIDE